MVDWLVAVRCLDTASPGSGRPRSVQGVSPLWGSTKNLITSHLCLLRQLFSRAVDHIGVASRYSYVLVIHNWCMVELCVVIHQISHCLLVEPITAMSLPHRATQIGLVFTKCLLLQGRASMSSNRAGRPIWDSYLRGESPACVEFGNKSIRSQAATMHPVQKLTAQSGEVICRSIGSLAAIPI